jgi:hypothetical protein
VVYARIACAAMVLSVVACGGGLDAGGETTTEPPVPTTSSISTTRPAGDTSTTATGSGVATTSSVTTVATTSQTSTPTTTTTTAITTTTTQAGGVTPSSLIQAIIADLAARRGVGAGQVELVSSESLDWPDGSLGCPVAGVSYIQVITPGYRVILGIGEETFDYRATVDGRFRLCENPLASETSPNPES